MTNYKELCKRLLKERDAAVEDLGSIQDNCRFCKYGKRYKPSLCSCPEPCGVDGNPDRWGWRGVQE